MLARAKPKAPGASKIYIYPPLEHEVLPMRYFLKRHTEFISNVAILTSGRTIAALIALFTMPIVARLFLPSDFGVAAMFVSITSVISSVASLRYGAALVLPKEDAEAVKIMAFAYRIMFAYCATLLLLIGVLEASDVTVPALDILNGWIWFVPVGVFLMNAVGIQESWFTRIKAFKLTSVSFVAGNTITTGTRIGTGVFFGSTVSGLIAGLLVGFASRLAIQQFLCKQGLPTAFQRIGWSEMREIARRYSDFPKLNAPAGLLFSMGHNLPVFLFGVLFSPVVAGFYAMADRLAEAPVHIIATSIRGVFLQKAASISQRGESLRKAFLLATGGLTLLGAIPFGVLWLFGQPILAWILGDRWFEAGSYIEIMAPWLFMIWVATPCHPVLIVLRQQHFWLSLQIALTLLRLAVFGIAYLIGAGPEWTLQAFVAVNVLGSLVTIAIVLALISRYAGR